jgi:hypothetical protein
MEAQMTGIMVEVADEGNGCERPERGQTEETIGTRSAPQYREALEMELEKMR